ncbi:hypothetical protein MWH28_07315 [Natroniella sulfidigena]|uniref:hypothetical protein n=1 Tax=Natroniella sulfidigena TaxID=723921 RepID=UPI00200AEDFC|nr:hypothetical protein [Natroniella sulfidigena]MCK8817168.1 hypothetical protein [Natroniella sulfidigena]
MNYELLSIDNAERIKNLLLNTPLVRPIEIEVEKIKLVLEVDGISMSIKSKHFKNMNEVYFMKDNATQVLQIKDKKYNLFYNIGEWGYETRIPNAHICLGTNYSKFGEYFSQLELSQAVEDEDFIYIIKKLSKLAGKGAMARLNNNLGNNKEMKYERRNMLVQKFRGKVINYNSQDWLCIDKISITELNKKSKEEEILYSILYNFLKYSLCIEEIIS